MNKKRTIYTVWALLAITYLVIAFVLQPDSATMAKYHLSATAVRVLSLAIIAPIVASWTAAVYGMVHMGRYANKIKDSNDGKGIAYLAWGLAVYSFGQIITAIISRLLVYLVTQHELNTSVMTIVNTHLTALVAVVSFGLFLFGSSKLLTTLKKAKVQTSYSFISGLVLAIISALYGAATLANPSRTVATGSSINASFYMPDWLIVTTIVLPYVIVWACGFFAVLFLRAYARNVGGAIYRRALSKLNTGFLIIIMSSISLQFLGAANAVISGWALNAMLALLFVLVLVIVAGYFYIAVGAKALSKLEDVT